LPYVSVGQQQFTVDVKRHLQCNGGNVYFANGHTDIILVPYVFMCIDRCSAYIRV
jgi:hypothetical protein